MLPPGGGAVADWGELFRLQVPIGESILRGTLTFVFLFGIMRLAGKREAGSLSLTDLLVVVLVAQAVGEGMKGAKADLLDGLVVVLVLFFWSILFDALAYRFPSLRRFLKSKPSPLIVDGKVNRRVLRRELMEHDELMAQLRLHGVSDVNEVALAYIETNGMVSIIRKDATSSDPGPEKPAIDPG